MRRIALRRAEYAVFDAGRGAPLLALHGFTGSHATWQPFARHWPVRLIAPDLLGHGDSAAPPDPRRYGTDETIADLEALLDELGIEQAVVLGYSMGGRTALRFALRAPQRLMGLILESTSPGIDDTEARRARVEADEQLATLLERGGIAAFVDQWESIPLWASQASLPDERRAALRRQRLSQRPGGLAASLRGAGAGRDLPVADQLGAIACPTLLISGEQDAKYMAEAARMSAGIPAATGQAIAAAGHAVHLEAPDAFALAIALFLEQLGCSTAT